MPHAFVTVLAQQPAPVPGSIVSTVWDLVLKGGWIMIPLGLCSLIAMTIVVERYIMTRRGRIAPPRLLGAMTEMKRNPRQALDRCTADTSPLGAVLAAALLARREPREVQEKRMGEAGQREVHKLRARMRLLSS